ncbi:MAG: sigma-70 family RNA polymerase sigma factor [Henriciella sp.]|uniref:RNA polymerase sigma factor n=1 Tax=Henriciella sp. TaxID=1968823 RepID=UPI0032EBACEA
MSNAVDDWFMQEVLPLEGELERFLQRHWSDEFEVRDLRQEVFSRLYKVAGNGLPRNTRALMYSTARHLIIDLIRRKRVVSIETVMDFESWDVSSDEAGPFDTVSARQELTMLRTALETLPRRTRDIVHMRRIQGLSQRETARALGVSEPTVERHVSQGVRLLADALGRLGVDRGQQRLKSKRKGRSHER